MTPVRRRRYSLALGGSAVALALAFAAVVAMPVAGQDPSPSPSASAKPGNGPPSQKPGKGPTTDKAAKVPEVAVTLTGRVGTRTEVDGDTTYTLTVGTTVYELEAGPPWWWGDKHPLKAFVGKTVTVGGERAQGSTEVDVLTVDGKTIREPGKPPWAGGWKVVGEKHPGWAQWKVDKAAARAEWKASGKGGPPPWAGPKGSPEPGD